MRLSTIFPPFRVECLMYRFAGSLKNQPAEKLPEGFAWHVATEQLVNTVFAADHGRRRRFLRFLRAGCFGIFLVHNGQWVSYGWSTQPTTTIRPPHLPRWCARQGAYWLFYFHTHENYRGQGHYKRMLGRMIATIQSRSNNPLIIGDILPDNIASRRAALQLGFVPCGVLKAYRPVRGVVLGGEWHRDQGHAPPITLSPSKLPR